MLIKIRLNKFIDLSFNIFIFKIIINFDLAIIDLYLFFGTRYNIIVNMEHPLVQKVWGGRGETAAADYAKDSELLHQLCDLALLANGMLKGRALSEFIARSEKLLG